MKVLDIRVIQVRRMTRPKWVDDAVVSVGIRSMDSVESVGILAKDEKASDLGYCEEYSLYQR